MELEEWYRSLPFVTKHMVMLMLMSAIVITYQVFDYSYLFLDTDAFKKL
jgi:hypothetical protein